MAKPYIRAQMGQYMSKPTATLLKSGSNEFLDLNLRWFGGRGQPTHSKIPPQGALTSPPSSRMLMVVS